MPLPSRMELSPDLISACLALEKYLDNPNALTERELVQWGPRPGRGGSFPITYTLSSPCLQCPLCLPRGDPGAWGVCVCLSHGPWRGTGEVGWGPRMISREQTGPWFRVLWGLPGRSWHISLFWYLHLPSKVIPGIETFTSSFRGQISDCSVYTSL